MRGMTAARRPLAGAGGACPRLGGRLRQLGTSASAFRFDMAVGCVVTADHLNGYNGGDQKMPTNAAAAAAASTALIKAANSALVGTARAYFPRGGPVPPPPPPGLQHSSSGWGGLDAGTGMLYPAQVVDGLTHTCTLGPSFAARLLASLQMLTGADVLLARWSSPTRTDWRDAFTGLRTHRRHFGPRHSPTPPAPKCGGLSYCRAIYRPSSRSPTTRRSARCTTKQLSRTCVLLRQTTDQLTGRLLRHRREALPPPGSPSQPLCWVPAPPGHPWRMPPWSSRRQSDV